MPLNIDWQQILLHLLNFTILTCILYFLAYSPIKKFMAKRKALIEDKEKQIEDKMTQAEQVKTQYQQQLEQFENEKADMKQAVNTELQEYKAQQMQQAQDKANKIVLDAKKTAQIEKDKIISGANKEIKKIVTDATEKIVLNSMSSDALDQFLASAERGEQDGKAS